MSEINIDDIVAKLEADQPLTVAELGTLEENPQIWDSVNLPPDELVAAKFQYGVNPSESEIKAVGIKAPRGAAGEALLRAIDNGYIGSEQVVGLLTDVFPEATEDIERKRTVIGSVGVVPGTGRERAQFLLHQVDLSGDAVDELINNMISFGGADLVFSQVRDTFAGTEVESIANAALEAERERRIDVQMAENPLLTREEAAADVDRGIEHREGLAPSRRDVDIGGGERLSLAESIAATDTLDPALGVPPGYVASVPDPRNPGQRIDQPPRYNERHIFQDELGRPYSDLPLEEKLFLQADLLDSGILAPGSFQPGVWDAPTREAWAMVLVQANGDGTTSREALDFLKITPFKESFDPSVFLSPDPASLATDARNYFEQRLGRRLSNAEVAEVADELALAHRLDFEAQLEATRAQDRANRVSQAEAIRGAATNKPSATGEVTAAQVGFTPDVTDLDADVITEIPQVDPNARLAQSFEHRFGALVDFNQQRDDATESKRSLMQSLFTMDTAIGGS